MNFEPLSPEESAVRLAAIVDASEDAIITTNSDGTIVTWNPAAQMLFGYAPEEILGQSILLLVPPAIHQEHLRDMEKLQTVGRIEHQETLRLRKGGAPVEISQTISAIRGPSGEIAGSAILAREISARRGEEAARARLAAIVDSSDDAIVAKDLNGVVTDWNAAAERLLGYKAEEMIGRSILTIIPPELQPEEPAILEKIRAGERVEHYETQRLHKSGARLEVSLTMSPIHDMRGRVIGVSKTVRDISERRKLETARMLLAAIVESSDDAIISKNLDGIITTWNAGTERLFGYQAEEMIGQSILRIVPRELHFEEPRIIAKLRKGERVEHYETRRRKKNGQIFDVSLTVSPIKDVRGRVIGGSKILRDISERKATEAMLLEKEKLAVAGRLAATLAHEVNNPLESITNLAYLLSQHMPLDDEARRYADLLLREAQRAGDITRQTLGYYRENKISAEVNLQDVMEHVLNAKRKRLQQKKINVVVDVSHVPTIKGFQGELRQVFDNLIDNAIDAVPTSGLIEIHARDHNQPTGHRVLIQICDDGPGIPSELLPRLFDPFFTTKPDKGSGLGLWVSRSIVEKHGGSIHVRSDGNSSHSGTTFTIDLPIAGAASAETASSVMSAPVL